MDLMQAMRGRRSVRAYKSDAVQEDSLQKLLTAAQLAPTGNNKQEWKLVVVRDAGLRKQINDACMQDFIGSAPVVLVACSYKASTDMNVAIVLDHITLAAAAEGLGTCWIRSFKEEPVKELLGVPEGASVVALMPVGYPVENPEMPERKPLDVLVSYDRF